MKLIISLLLLLSSPAVMAGTTTAKQLDAIANSTGGSSIAVPSAGTAFATDTNSLTVTNKVISGANNTLQNLPVSSQIVQDLFYGNGTSTTFSMSFTPPATSGVTVQLDGVVLIQGSGNDYTISGSTITMSVAPATGQKILAIYSKF